MIVLTLPYPISANAYWGTRIVKPRGKSAMAMVYVTHEARGYKADVAKICAARGITQPLVGRIALAIRVFPHRPLDWQKRQRQLGIAWDDTVRALDLDNANKVLLDALKGIAFEDDKWVRRLQAERMEPDEHGARVIVAIEQLHVEVRQSELLPQSDPARPARTSTGAPDRGTSTAAEPPSSHPPAAPASPASQLALPMS